IVRPVTWQEWPETARKIFQAMRSAAGEEMVLQKNVFVERILPASVVRGLTPEEMDRYRTPYREAGESRRPTLTWPREIPVDGEPADVVRIVKEYGEWLAKSPIPKLFINADPGSILVGAQRDFCRRWPNQREVTVRGSHFVQEDSPNEIGRALADFVRRGCLSGSGLGTRPERRGRVPEILSRLVVLVDHQPHGHLPLLGGGRPLLCDGAELDEVDPRELEALLDEEATNRLDPTLTQSDVVGIRSDGVGVALEIDRQIRVLLQLLDDTDQRGLGIVAQIPLVEAEQDLVGLDLVPRVAVGPQPGQPAVRLVGLGISGIRAVLSLGERSLGRLQPGIHSLD